MRAFRLAYDGREWYGFQRQPDVPTVESRLFDALETLSVLPAEASKPLGYAAAGRTDRGVSALAQTVALECPEWLTPRALNSELPPTIRAWASADVETSFHATHDAVRREYTYYLYAPSIEAERLDARTPVDDDRARGALELLCGSHDFSNLTPDTTGTRRGLSGRLTRHGAFLEVGFAAGGFARELVRRLISVIQRVATGQQSLEWVERLLGPTTVEPRPPPASPEPLVLSNVVYPGVDFDGDPDAADSAKRTFGQQAVDALVTERVSRSILNGVDH